MSIEQKVIDVLSEMLGLSTSADKDKITRDSLIKEDLNLDSLGAVEMLYELESEYGIDISDEDAMTFSRVGDVVAYLESRGLK